VDNRAKALSTAFLISSWNFFFAADHEEFEEKAVCGCLSTHETLCDSEWFLTWAGGGAAL
jgi:hypothetical protein